MIRADSRHIRGRRAALNERCETGKGPMRDPDRSQRTPTNRMLNQILPEGRKSGMIERHGYLQHGRPHPEESGFTLLEVTISLVLAVILMGLAVSIATHLQIFAVQEEKSWELTSQGTQVLQRIKSRLRHAVAATTQPLSMQTSTFIQFQGRTLNAKDEVVDLPPEVFWYEPADENPITISVDGVEVTKTRGGILYQEGDATPVPIAGDVTALEFHRELNGVSISVELVTRDPRGSWMLRTFQQFVAFRN